MLSTTTKVIILLSTIYHTWGDVNVAFNKPAMQSSTFEAYTADKAVNGQTNDFTHTEADGLSKWWTVDLLARYSIDRITLYNRVRSKAIQDRLAKISILTSTVLAPAEPSLTHSDWTIRNYRDEAYGSSGTVAFDSPIRAQHVAVYMENVGEPLSLAELEVNGVAVNLALNKPARQVSNYSSPGYLAGKAVNGNINDFSHTAADEGNKWWTVDLQAKYSIETITLYNRQDRVDLQPQLAKIRILTSTASSPANPDPPSGDWSLRQYREEAYGSNGIVTFDLPIEAQHVAVYSENAFAPLALAEVQVYGDYNYAFGKTASQSSTYKDRTNIAADKAVDGDFSTNSITNFDQPNNQWWKVDLGDGILLREVTVYVRNGTCGSINCSSRLSDVYFLTNYRDAGAAPRTDGVANWSICYHSETALGDSYTVQCDTGYQNPVARLFSIRTNNGISVELREVYVFGYALPELSGDIAITAEGKTTSSITITFSQWNQQMIGELPPTLYIIQLSGGESKTVVHNSGSQRLNTTFNGLDPGETYAFTVSCTIQGVACTGSTHSIDVSPHCTVPDVPGEITLANVKMIYNGRQMWKYNAVWVVPAKANCPDVLQYQYNVTGQSASTLQTTTTATFYLDGDLSFEFVVRAKNSKGYSPTRSKSGRSDVLKPQFTDGQVSVTGKNSYCVTVAWQSPTYPGGTITQYQYQCGSEGRQTVHDENRSKDSCNYEPNTEVTCTVWATNSAGDGSIQNSGKTLCTAPDAPGTISQESAVNRTEDSRQRWRYTVTWRAPANVNCDDVLKYSYGLSGQPLSSLKTERRGSFVVDGDVQFVFVVRAKNSVGFSGTTTYNGTSGVLEPQFTNGQSSVTGKSSTCVTLTWASPTYPGGAITQYQYQCDGEHKQILEDGIRSTDSCNYEPNTEVTCTVWATNSAGNGFIHNSGKTLCAVPSVPRTLTISTPTKTNTAVIQWEFNATWMEPIKSNCDDTIKYKYGIHGVTNSTLQSGRKTTFYLHGDQPYSFVVKAENSIGLSGSLSEIGRSPFMKPQFGDSQFTLVATNSSCLTLSWQIPQYSGGNVSVYQYQCGEAEPKQRGADVFTGYSCGYNPNTDVTCKLIARNEAGDSTEQIKSATTDCSVPAPEFTLYSLVGGNKTASINISLKALHGTCAVNVIYTIRIKHPDGSFVHNQTSTTGGSYIISNLHGFTNYTVTIEIVNNEGLRSESTQYIVTVETLPLDGPTLELSFTEDCVLLHLQPPQTPNGEILNYQHRCAKVERQLKESLAVLAQDIEAAFIPSWCGFPQAIQVVCETYAVNNVGESPTTTASGYTNAAVASSATAQLIPPTETKSELVVINIRPAQLEDSTLHISSYLVLLKNRTAAGVKRSTEEKCDVDRQDCLPIAEIDSERVTVDGYWFYIGDGRIYGGYVNSALVPKSSYSVQIAISVQLPEGGGTFYQSLDDVLSFTVPFRYCQPPPTVENAMADSTSNATIGDTVLYTCESGYQTGGDNILTCALTESYESDWVGSDVICDNAEPQKKNWIVGVSAGIATFILLAVGIAIAVVIMKKRSQTPASNGNDPLEPMELSDYMHPPAENASNYTELNFGVTVNVSKPDDDCEYDTVAADAKPEDEYETIPADASTSDHVYASC